VHIDRQKTIDYVKKIFSKSEDSFSNNDGIAYIEPNSTQKSNSLKSDFIVSNLPVSYIFQTTLIVPKDVLLDDVPLLYEEEVLTDLALSPEDQYILKVEKTDGDLGRSYEYNTLVARTSDIEKLYEIADMNHLDLLVPTPYLFESLYDDNLLTKLGKSVIIYIDKNEVFGALYSDGKLALFKKLGSGLDEMVEAFNELSPEIIDKDKLLELIGKGGDEVLAAPLKKVYSLFAEEINDFLIYAKRVQKISDFGTLYIESLYGVNSYFLDFIAGNYGYECKRFEFREGLIEQKAIGIIKAVALKWALVNFSKKVWCNFTIFERQPPLLKRASGQMVSMFLLSTVLALAYPAYNYIDTYITDAEIARLKKENGELQKQKEIFDTALSTARSELEQSKEELKKSQDEYRSVVDVLENFVNYQKEYRQKSRIIVEINGFLQKDGLYLSALSFEEGDKKVRFVLETVAGSEQAIASFVNTLIKEGGFSVSINEISKKDGIYTSSISAEK